LEVGSTNDKLSEMHRKQNSGILARKVTERMASKVVKTVWKKSEIMKQGKLQMQQTVRENLVRSRG
jgi:hypothetical protein